MSSAPLPLVVKKVGALACTVYLYLMTGKGEPVKNSTKSVSCLSLNSHFIERPVRSEHVGKRSPGRDVDPIATFNVTESEKPYPDLASC